MLAKGVGLGTKTVGMRCFDPSINSGQAQLSMTKKHTVTSSGPEPVEGLYREVK